MRSIKSALAAMFAVLAVVTGLQGLITYGQLVQTEGNVESVADRQLPSLAAIRDISSAVLRVRSKEFRLVLSELDDKVIENNAVELANDRMELQAARDRYEPLIDSDDERRLYEQLSRTLVSYAHLTAPLPDLMKAHQVDLAHQLLLQPWLRVLFSTADAQLRNAVLLNEKRAKTHSMRSVAALTHAKVVALISTVAAAVLAALAIAVSYFRFLKPLGIVTAALNQLAAGNIQADLPPSRRRDEIGAMGRAVEVFRSSLIRARLAEAERLNTQLFVQNIAASTPDGIVAFNHAGTVTFCNQAAEALLGMRSEQMVGEQIDRALSLRSWLPAIDSTVPSDQSGRTIETEVRHQDGHSVPVELSYSQWQQDGRVMACAILRDIRDRKRDEAVLHRLAHSDALTGLPNRVVLTSRMADALKENRPFAVLLIDLDHFKQVNDIFGHQIGDEILKKTGDRLRACSERGNTVTRLGGDEFILLLEGHSDPLRIAGIADAVVKSLSEPFAIAAQTIHLGASVGIAIAPTHGADPEELMSCADLALYAVKAQGRHGHRLFTSELRGAAMRDSTCRQELPGAVERNEFVLFYQPQVRLQDGALVGAEALIRWQHPEFGLVSPDRFVHVLETSHLAEEVGDWVIRTACRQARKWREIWPDFRMGVNLSGAHFRSGRLAETVSRILAEFDLPGAALEVEITEHIILRHDEHLVEPLRELQRLGVSVAFDDYGTGYASLSLLKRFPLNRLKIDRSFVRTILESETDASIVHTILHLGASLGLGVIAEGVETQGQLETLKQKGCGEAQGYLFGRPLPPDAFQQRFVPALADRSKRA